MLKLYGARECIDKEKFIYDNLTGRAYVIVPNQYTLVAEQQAIHYLDTSCLFDVEIVSMNRLGLRMLTEKGLENTPVLDKYGRFMLLSKIIREHKDDLEVFKTASGRKTFIEMVNDFISDFKQQDCSIAELDALLEAEDTHELLRKKLSELNLLMAAYEQEIAGKYTDSEDYIGMYINAIRDAKLLEGHEIWVYGFDSLTPKFMDALTEMATRVDVHLIINESDQLLDERLVAALYKVCDQKQIPVSQEEIAPIYAFEKAETIAYLEKNLFARQANSGKAGAAGPYPGGNRASQTVAMVECANPFYEAESAAVYVHHLLRDKGYRMKDIVIICNDEDGRQPVIRRTFEEYGLPLFVDSRRSISDSTAAGFLISQLDFLRHRYRTSSLLVMLKTGLTGSPRGDVENLENYVRKYGIKGSMWKKPFKYGTFEYSDAQFAALEHTRKIVIDPLLKLEEIARGSKTIREFAYGFAQYLEENWQLRDRLEREARDQAEKGFVEASQNTAQSYDACVHILEQVVEILGDEPMDLDEFTTLYESGLETVEIGLIPPALDGITMGTMIRTRTGPVRAVLILGANEGTLPMEPSPEGLFSVDEKAFFNEHRFPLGSLDDLKMLEENSAMYRMISKPSEQLYVSWSLSDSTGKDCRPSVLVDSLKAALPGVHTEKDVVSQGFSIKLVNNKRQALRHLMNHLKERPAQAPNAGAGADGPGAGREDLLAHALLGWYEEHEPDMLKAVLAAGLDENKADPISPELARRLFARDDGDYSFSASRLEKYYRCPFEHFVSYGLNPHEEREFRSSGREIGDMYHECIMKVSKRLSDADAWNSCSGKEIADMVDEELKELSSSYRGGLFLSDGREAYRLERIRQVCEDAVIALAQQIKEGKVRMSWFEEHFGRGYTFEPIEYSLGGEKVYIEGKIDRIDLMEGGDIRIIDYKTGNDQLDIDQMRCGYKMQLMVYMKGALHAKGGTDYKPAGLFYFNISDKELNVNKMDTAKMVKKLQEDKDSRFSLKGAVVDDPDILAAMPPQAIDRTTKKLSAEDFEALENDVHKAIESISDGIVKGDIRISPTRLKKKPDQRECAHCDYRSICKFDLTYKDNKYRLI